MKFFAFIWTSKIKIPASTNKQTLFSSTKKSRSKVIVSQILRFIPAICQIKKQLYKQQQQSISCTNKNWWITHIIHVWWPNKEFFALECFNDGNCKLYEHNMIDRQPEIGVETTVFDVSKVWFVYFIFVYKQKPWIG